MDVNDFFNLLLEEIKENSELRGYYKFLEDKSRFDFRKSYFLQRLQFISDHVSDKSSVIWDCGSGYGTSCIFLAINGYSSHGSTLEFYFNEIKKRKEYWSKHGNMDLFSTSYEDIYENHPEENSIDIIILQDTLHHLEPLQDALKIFNKVLKPGGKIILVEENGSNIIQNLKLYKQRGNKRVINYYDEKLGKTITMGNENIRSLNKWRGEFAKQGFKILDDHTRYIRYYPPFVFGKKHLNEVIAKENSIATKNAVLRKYFFFGINVIVEKI